MLRVGLNQNSVRLGIIILGSRHNSVLGS